MRFNCKLPQEKKPQVIRTLFSPQFNNMSKHPFSTGHFGIVLNNRLLLVYAACVVLTLPGFAVRSSSCF